MANRVFTIEKNQHPYKPFPVGDGDELAMLIGKEHLLLFIVKGQKRYGNHNHMPFEHQVITPVFYFQRIVGHGIGRSEMDEEPVFNVIFQGNTTRIAHVRVLPWLMIGIQ